MVGEEDAAALAGAAGVHSDGSVAAAAVVAGVSGAAAGVAGALCDSGAGATVGNPENTCLEL